MKTKICLMLFLMTNSCMIYSQYELKDFAKDTICYSNINIELFYPNNSYKSKTLDNETILISYTLQSYPYSFIAVLIGPNSKFTEKKYCDTINVINDKRYIIKGYCPLTKLYYRNDIDKGTSVYLYYDNVNDSNLELYDLILDNIKVIADYNK